MATDHNFKVKNGLHVEGADTKLVDAGSGNAKLEVGGTLSIRPEGTTSNKHFFELNNYTAAGNIAAATMSTTGDTDFGGRGDFAKDLRIRGDGSTANAGVVRFHTNSNGQLFIDPANDGSNQFLFNTNGNLTVPGDLIVNGTTTTLNTATLTIDDKKITIADGAGSSANADESGFEIGVGAVGASSNPSILYKNTGTLFESNQHFKISSGKILRVNTVNNADNTANIIYRSSTDTIVGNNANALVVQDGGQVGMGVTDPLTDLHVRGNNSAILRVDAQDGGSAPAMTSRIQIYGYEGRGAGIKIRDSVNSASSANNREWFVGSGYGQSGFNIGYASDGVQSSYAAQNKLTILTSGNVGIGTSSPGQKLDVDGNTTSTAYILRANGSAPTADAAIFRAADNTLAFSTASTERLRIDSDGTIIATGLDHTFYSGGTEQSLSIGRNANERFKIRVTDGDITLTADQDSDGNSTHNFVLDREFAGSGANNFQIKKDGALQFNLNTSGHPHFYKGTSFFGTDDSIPGTLYVYGGASGNDEGGEIRLYTSADHDSSYQYYRIDAYQDDLRIGREGQTDIYLFQNGSVKIENSNLILNHDLDMANNKDINFFNSSGVDDGTKITRATGNAFRFKYTGNSLIFDALNDNQVSFRNSDDEEVVRVVPNSTPTSSSLDVVGNLRINTTTVIDSSRNLSSIGTITASGDMAIDTDTLFVDVSADRVGIGEDSVDMKLHISDSTTPGIKFERPGTAAWRAGVSGTSFQISDSSDTLASPELVLTNSGRLQVNHDAVALASQPAIIGQFDSTGTDGLALIQVQHLTTSTAQALGAGITFKTGDGASGSATKEAYIFLQGGNNSNLKYIADRGHQFYVDHHDDDLTGTNYNDYGTLAMSILESGVVTIGTTSTTPGFSSTNGHAFHTGDASHISRNSGTALVVNRGTDDGDIINLRRAGTSIGVIGVAANDNLYIAGGSGGTHGIYLNDIAIVPAAQGGAPESNTLDLGTSSHKFKDLHLGGDILLPYGSINDSGTDLVIHGTNAVVLKTDGGTAITIPNNSTDINLGSGKLNFSRTSEAILLDSAHSKTKIGLFGGIGTGAEYIGTSANTVEISGTNVNLNGASGSGTANLQMGGTTVIDSSRNISNIGSISASGDITSSQFILSKIYGFANTGGDSDQYIKFGTLSNTSQDGRSLTLRISSNNGYNAAASQNQDTIVRFKTSNGSSNNSGFYGDCQTYQFGENANAPIDVIVKQVSTTEYEFYGKFATFTGAGSFYVVEHRFGTWTHSGSNTGSTAPSGTTITATARQIFTSGTTNQSVTLQAGALNISGNVDIGGNSANPTLTLNKSATGQSRIDFDNAGSIKARIELSSGEDFHIKTGGTPTERLEITESGVIKFNNAYTFPTSDGSNGQVLQTNGSGALSFASVSGGTITSASNMSDNRVLTASGSTTINGESNLTFNGSTLTVTGDITTTGELTIPNKIIHSGDTDTYLQFHAANQFRVVAGNTEITEWRSDRMQMTNKAITFGNWSNFSDTALTDINYATLNAPIHIPAVNVGSADKYLPILQGSAQHTQGYRTSYVFGGFKKATSGAGWGDGQTGFFMGMGGNDNNPTKEFRFTWDGRIWYTDAGSDTYLDFDTDSHIKFVTSGVQRGEFDDSGINIVSGGYQISGTTRIDSSGKFFPASLNSTGKISVLNGSSAQGIRVNTLYAGTTYANDGAASGTVDTLNGYMVQGNTVINNSRGLTNITSANIAGNVTIDYTGNATNDAGLFIANDNSDWGIKVDKDGTATYGLSISADGAHVITCYNSSGTEKFRLDGDGDIETIRNVNSDGYFSGSSYVQAGRGGGGVALTINDGQGNANVTFNHQNGAPEQAGNCGRITMNTDSTSGAKMTFELVSNSGTSVINTPSRLELTEDGAFFEEYLYHLGDTNTYIRFTGDAITLRAGGRDMINIIEGSDDYVEIDGRLQLRDNIDLKMFHSSSTSGANIHMPRAGAMTFYGDTSIHHCIRSANQSNGEADDILISSYGAIYFDLDSNNNNTSGADFIIGRHNSTSANLFEVDGENGQVISANDVTAFGSPSDIRLKENIEVIADPIEKVLKLRGVTFNYKDTGKKSTGLIAQDLEEVLPEVVYETHDINNKEDKFKAVRYGNTVGLLVEAIKEQQTIINRLEERIKKLEGENNGD